MFRIDRNLVNLSAARSVQVDKKDMEAGAAGENPDAAASAVALIREELLAEVRAEVRAESHAETLEKAKEIIEEAQSEAQAKARDIVEAAREEAAQIVLTAREESEAARYEAWRDGFTDGSEEGRHSFDAMLETKQREDEEKLNRVLDELYTERESTFSGLEANILELAMDIVRKVVNPDEENLGAYESIIKNSLKQINPDGRIVIRVCPADYERFFSSGNAVFNLDGGMTVKASVLRDVSLGESDCIIDTEESTVNAGLESQLKYIKLAFERA